MDKGYLLGRAEELAEQAEKKKSVVAQLRNAPPAQEHREKTAEKSTERER